MPIINETFEYYREQQSKIKKAIKILKANGYTVYKTNQYLGHKITEDEMSAVQ